MPFETLSQFQEILKNAPQPDKNALTAATERNMQLTKPPGALGKLESLAIWYAAWRGTATPRIEQPQVAVFAGNHGIAAQGVSAFPPEVTVQMVMNFQHGGAAINQLCKTFGTELTVEALDLDSPTADFTQGPAMSEDEVVAALKKGWNAVDPITDLFVAGEMGIGNTTSAAAISHALYGGKPSDWTGRGTGVSDAGLEFKTEVVARGLAANPEAKQNGLKALQCLGGKELAAMAGAIARARNLSIPVLMDGFICTSAAACLEMTQSGALDHCQAAHQSDEQAHKVLLSKLNKKPLLDFEMRLGEGSGGALGIGIMQAAVNCHSGMATFAEAGVSNS